MITQGRRTVYEPKDYPVAPWAQRMAEEFEQGRVERRQHAEELAREREEERCDQRQR